MTRRAGEQGQGVVEFIVIFLGFAALFLGLFEITRVYRAKHLLSTATFQAARTGALVNARRGPMNAELANAMTPLMMGGARSAEGLAQAQATSQVLVARPGLGIEIVSPTRQAFDQLAVIQWLRRSDESAYRWQSVIPNDNLRYRPRQVADLGSGASLNVQDANLLRVRSLWCHRLVTPALDRVIFGILNLPAFTSPRQQACTALSDGAAAGIPVGLYVPVSADATVRMQSAVVADALS